MSGNDKEDDKVDTLTKKDKQAVESKSSSLGIDNANAKKNPSLVGNHARTNDDVTTGGVTTDKPSSRKSVTGPVSSKRMSNETRPSSKTTKTMKPAATGSSGCGVKAAATPRTTSDRKVDFNSIRAKIEATEEPATKSKTETSAPVMTPKQSQQNPHPKQQIQHQRYLVSGRQNQEEAVSKMVQNIFKLLETRGPLTMAQLEYNLPLLVAGSAGSSTMIPQPMSATAQKSNSAGPKVSILQRFVTFPFLAPTRTPIQNMLT